MKGRSRKNTAGGMPVSCVWDPSNWLAERDRIINIDTDRTKHQIICAFDIPTMLAPRFFLLWLYLEELTVIYNIQ